MRLSGKVAIVTGGGWGLGRAYALGLAREGASVVCADIRYAEALDTADRIRAAGGQALALDTDVTEPEMVQAMVRVAGEAFGRVDILVNNAGVCYDLVSHPLEEIPVEEWDQVMAVNVKGMFLCCQAVLPFMKAQGRGKIINISSVTAFIPPLRMLHYVTSKAAVIGLTRALAVELGRYGIRVNAIAPGLVLSEGGQKITNEQGHQWAIEHRAIRAPLFPQDLVGSVLFLAGEESDAITGQTIVVDGGQCLH